LKTLHYLGIYKHHNSVFWGWDYVRISAQRIINEEFGFRESDLESHLMRIDTNWNPLKQASWIKTTIAWLVTGLVGGPLPQLPTKDSLYEVGDEVEVIFGEEWYPGVIEELTQRFQGLDAYVVFFPDEDGCSIIEPERMCEPGKCSDFLHWQAYVEESIERMQSWAKETCRACLYV
jgi:hypothetical protein